MNEQNCKECGTHWDCATFLSESFNYSGGTMVFECQCGNTKSRYFIPTDIMPVEESVKYLMIQEGMNKDIVESAMNHYKVEQSLKKISQTTSEADG